MRQWDGKGRKVSPPPPKKSFIDEQVTSVGNLGPIPLGNFLVNHVEHSAELLHWQRGKMGYLSLKSHSLWLRVEKSGLWHHHTCRLLPQAASQTPRSGEIPQTEKEKHRSSRWKCDGRLGTVSMCSFRWTQASWVYGKGHQKSLLWKPCKPRWGFFSSWWNSWGQLRNWVIWRQVYQEDAYRIAWRLNTGRQGNQLWSYRYTSGFELSVV